MPSVPSAGPQPTLQPPAPARRGLNPYLALAIGMLAVSMAGPFIRAALLTGALPLTVAVLRLTIASLVLTVPALLRVRDEYKHLDRRDILLMVVSGLLLAGHFVTWIASFAFTTVMSSVVLVSTTPIWVGLVSPLFLKERNPLRTWAGIALAIGGSVLIGVQDAQANTLSLRGNFLALAGAILGAGYFMITRRMREQLSLLAYIWLVYGTAAIALLIWTSGQVLFAGFQLGGFAPLGLLWIVLLALVPHLIGHTSINHALRHVPATIVSLAVLFEPIGSTVLAAIFFAEIPGGVQLLGAALILVGIAFGSRQTRTDEPSGHEADALLVTTAD